MLIAPHHLNSQKKNRDLFGMGQGIEMDEDCEVPSPKMTAFHFTSIR